jgi:hypothetical protein
MNADLVLFRLRRFLLALSGVLLLGTFVELVFTGHTKEPVQLIPFFLCILWGGAVVLALVNTHRRSLLFLRTCMVVVVLGSLLGIYEHIANNIAFQLEIEPSISFAGIIAARLGGANPLIAPGILAVGASLAIAATYDHPGLARVRNLPPQVNGQNRVAWDR